MHGQKNISIIWSNFKL